MNSTLFKILGEFYINYWDDNTTGKYIPFLYLINLKFAWNINEYGDETSFSNNYIQCSSNIDWMW